MRTKPAAGALGLALVFSLQSAVASAAYRGTDMWSNLVPGGSDGLAARHPISYYALDYHVAGPSLSNGGGDLDKKAIQLLASVIVWFAFTAMRVAIAAFDWAYNMDVIGGDNGALKPVGIATQNLWFSTFQQLMTTGVLILGGWLVYKLAQRKFGELGTGLVRAVLLVAVALAIIFNPGATIGRAASLSNDFASAIVGADGADQMFETFIYKPWVVLEFGGLKHCVDWSNKSPDGFPMAASDSTPNSAKQCRDHLRSHNDYGGYAERFLRYPADSKARDREYEALVKGRLPTGNGPGGDMSGDLGISEPIDPHQFDGYKVDKVDAPAVDMMQAQGAIQRIGYAVLLCLGIVSAILLLGLICLASLFAQLGLLVMLAVTPAIVIAAIFPGLHGVFIAWAKLTGLFLVSKIVYAIILHGSLGISSSLMALGGSQGYLPAFGAQSALFVGLFAFRKKLASPLTSHRSYNKSEKGFKNFVTTAAATGVGAMVAPVSAATKVGAAGKARMESINQQHAKNPETSSAQKKPDEPQANRPRPDSTSPPASAGREYSPMPIGDESSTAVATIDGNKQPAEQMRGEDPVPMKSFREEYSEAKVDPKDKPPEAAPHAAKPLNGVGRVESFDKALEQERAKTPNS